MFQTTSIGRSTPGSGRAAASASIASRVAARQACPRVDPHGVVRTSPGSADLAVDEERARPDARRPEPLPLIRAAGRAALAPLRRAGSRHRRSAAGARARRPSRRRASPARRLRAATRRRVASGPAAAILRARRMQWPPSAARSRPSARTRRPWSARRCGGSVERARGARRPGRSRQRPPSRRSALARRPSGSRPCPSSRRTSARSGRCRARARPRGPSCARRRAGRAAARPMRSARSAALGVVGKPPEREQREVALGDDIGVVARPPELGERRILPRRRLDPVDPRVQRQQRGSRHAVLQAGPRRPPQRLRALRHPLVEPTDPSPERQDLLPREPESRSRRHFGRAYPERPT